MDGEEGEYVQQEAEESSGDEEDSEDSEEEEGEGDGKCVYECEVLSASHAVLDSISTYTSNY